MDILEVHNLTKKFGKFVAVDNISFSLKKGEILGLLGPNGAGKTTTIQMLLGVLTPTSGKIAYFGKDFFSNKETILEKVNFSSTYTNLPWSLTIKENLTFIAYLYDIKDRKSKVEEIMEIFRLKELENHAISELSAGQVTRVNLAKAFVNDPEILLLDEPTASLDPEIAKFVRDFILNERDQHDISIIFTSHNMPEVEEICDRILFINDGKIIADDTPTNLAKTIDTATVNIMVDKNDKQKFMDLLTEKGRKYSLRRNTFRITIKENQIARLLGSLIKRDIYINEISIDKPTLEDYFLKVAQKDKMSFSEVI